jgi:hypothetical protein
MSDNKEAQKRPSGLIRAEIPIIEKIIRDETWYEGERRGHPVSPDDPAVIESVCRIVQKDGETILQEAKRIAEEKKNGSKP